MKYGHLETLKQLNFIIYSLTVHKIKWNCKIRHPVESPASSVIDCLSMKN